MFPGNHAVTLKAIHVCASWIYVIDQILLPTPTANLSQVPPVNATFLRALASLGGTGGTAATPVTGTTGVGAITDPVRPPHNPLAAIHPALLLKLPHCAAKGPAVDPGQHWCITVCSCWQGTSGYGEHPSGPATGLKVAGMMI